MDQSMERFQKGNQYVDIASAVGKNELTSVDGVNDDYLKHTNMKFVPASGAATRMFKNLYTYLDDQKNTDYVEYFFEHLEDFAFYEELKTHVAMEELDKNKDEDRAYIIKNLLNNEMNYGSLPKALIKFHRYEERVTTPIDEHIFEGEKYLDPDDVDLHFTIAPEDEEAFKDYVKKAAEGKDPVKISYSFQKEKTDTMAVDMNNEPFKLENGEILYRPGGHGALLANLNDLDADIIFIKNIDNVCHKSRAEETIDSKKMLASVGLEVKQEIDGLIEELLSDDYDLAKVETLIREKLNITPKDGLTKDQALAFLNRPLRVCGMVENSGEPGGGPYVVDNGDYYDLQICEKSEIDMSDEEQVAILNDSEYFNPVDIVCFVKDYLGEKFDLLNYANEDRYFISEKTHEGKKLKALEHPGLWNGGMHNWNTLFVEVPASTFNPVKSVNDLLRPGHQSTD